MLWRQRSVGFESDGFIPPGPATIRQNPPEPAISFGEKVLTAFSAGLARGLISLLDFFAHAVVYSAFFCGRVRRGARENDEVLPVVANDRQMLPDAATICRQFRRKWLDGIFRGLGRGFCCLTRVAHGNGYNAGFSETASYTVVRCAGTRRIAQH